MCPSNLQIRNRLAHAIYCQSVSKWRIMAFGKQSLFGPRSKRQLILALLQFTK
jgi:hypothetical protein